MLPWGTARTCPLASDARGLLGVDVALGAAGGDQITDLGLQPGFLVTGGGPGVADDRHARFLPLRLNDIAGIMMPSVRQCIWQTSYGCVAPAIWGGALAELLRLSPRQVARW